MVNRSHEIAIACGVVFRNFAVFTRQVIDCSPLVLMVVRLIFRYSEQGLASKVKSVELTCSSRVSASLVVFVGKQCSRPYVQ